MKKIILLFTVITLLTACEKEEDNKSIVLQEGQANHQTWADDIQGKGGVTFKTTGAWSSTIVEKKDQKSIAEETCDWLTIDPMSGDSAGTYTINIQLKGNFTGIERTATISIECNGQSMPIMVTQKAQTEDGKIPNEHVTGLMLNKTSLKLDKWTSEKLIASIAPVYAANKTVFWSSSNESVVTVDNNGLVTPYKWASVGANATITAITQDGAKTALCVVSIVNPAPNGLGTFLASDESTQVSEQFVFNFARQYCNKHTGYNIIEVEFLGENSTFNCQFAVSESENYLNEGTFSYIRDENGDGKADFRPGVFACSSLLVNYKQYPNGGNVVVSLLNETYTITFNVNTDYNDSPGKITGSYTGKIRIDK